MPYIAEHLYECPVTRKQYGTGLTLPKGPPKTAVQLASEVMLMYSRADIIARCKASPNNEVSLPVQLPATNQTQRPLCWDWGLCQMVEVEECCTTGVQPRLDVSIAPCEDGVLNSGNDIHAAWDDGLAKYGICTAAFMGTDPTAKTRPDMLRSLSQFPTGWQEEAKKRLGVKRYEVTDFLQLCSGILNGHPGNGGVNCDGGGHNIGATTVGWSERNGLYTRTPGTWGDSYASGWASDPQHPGTYTIYEDGWSAAWNGYGCFVIVSVRNDGATPDLN